ncbi:MAG: hypothetical protein ACR2RD_14640 [Woeseiaceae bacterium]
MKCLYLLATQLAGKTSGRIVTATVTLPYAVLRVLRLWVDELPFALSYSATILEWMLGILGLFVILRRKFEKRTENNNASVS